GGDRQAVARDADEAHETLLTRFDGSLERPVFAQSELPLDHVDEVVQLYQVEAVDTEPVERAPNLLPRSLVVPPAGLGRQEEGFRVALQPWRNAKLGVAVRGGRVDV